MQTSLIQKYNVPGPRYTSYPTVPYWDETSFDSQAWQRSMVKAYQQAPEEGLSIYIHLPFCESLCTFCGCSKRITKNHAHEDPYIEAVLAEWKMYCELFADKPLVKELHLGGGTPTFFSAGNLKRLIDGIFEYARMSSDREFSFEGHPNNTTREHLQQLYDLGFRRVSFGVQDYSETVQKAIHRIQPFNHVARVTLWAREIGYESVGHDLVFGLPFQNLEGMTDTIEKTKALRPDRIAFYSYAHVPWIKGNGQRGFNEADLPSGEQKRELYEKGREMLEAIGYLEIGMDHFALPSDRLYKSFANGTLHRNFMGYTSVKSHMMIGLGISAIGDSGYAFGQNTKSLETYYAQIGANEFPLLKGHVLSDEDLRVRDHILDLMCRFETRWTDSTNYTDILDDLAELERDGLIERMENGVRITERGKTFTRNVCMAFDLHLKRNKPQTQLFSMTV